MILFLLRALFLVSSIYERGREKEREIYSKELTNAGLKAAKFTICLNIKGRVDIVVGVQNQSSERTLFPLGQ